MAFCRFESLRQNVLPAALIWPLLVWSGLGCRETRQDTRQIVFSAPHPLRNRIPLAWLAGFGVALLMGGTALVQFGLAGREPVVAAGGAALIPSLALALGVPTGRAFEVVYVVFWYLGLLNKVFELDFVGLHTANHWPAYLVLSLALFVLALLGRQRQLKS